MQRDMRLQWHCPVLRILAIIERCGARGGEQLIHGQYHVSSLDLPARERNLKTYNCAAGLINFRTASHSWVSGLMTRSVNCCLSMYVPPNTAHRLAWLSKDVA